MPSQLSVGAVLLAVDRDSAAYTAGRIFGDVLILATAVALLLTGSRRERQGRNGTPWYVGGAVLLVAALAAFARRGGA